jgi:hypothetical protein
MDNNIPEFVKINDNIVIHKNTILWIQKATNDCVVVCNKMEGMYNTIGYHKICRSENAFLYDKLKAPFYASKDT